VQFYGGTGTLPEYLKTDKIFLGTSILKNRAKFFPSSEDKGVT